MLENYQKIKLLKNYIKKNIEKMANPHIGLKSYCTKYYFNVYLMFKF